MHLKDMVHSASICKPENLLLPVRSSFVVDDVRSAQFLRKSKLLIRRRSGNDMSARGDCNLQTKAVRTRR